MVAETYQDRGTPVKYFIMVPHIDDDDLDPDEYRLLGHYRKIAGLSNHADITESVEETAVACKMSQPRVRAARNRLIALNRIEVQSIPGKETVVFLADIWLENVTRYTNFDPSRIPQGYRNQQDTPHEFDRTPLTNSAGVAPQKPAQTDGKLTRLIIEEDNNISANLANAGSGDEFDSSDSFDIDKVPESTTVIAAKAKRSSLKLAAPELVNEQKIPASKPKSKRQVPRGLATKSALEALRQAVNVIEQRKLPYAEYVREMGKLRAEYQEYPADRVHQKQVCLEYIEKNLTTTKMDRLFNAICYHFFHANPLNPQECEAVSGRVVVVRKTLLKVYADVLPSEIVEFAAWWKENKINEKTGKVLDLKSDKVFVDNFGEWRRTESHKVIERIVAASETEDRTYVAPSAVRL